ncbi:spore coat protein GerQ [Bacillus massiliigorillae]|uniref:spore coat protein GerQ n=1 Tax=Bacillus massiliigorillae TaxID=1243664 RepID=UPI0003AA0512|nr:spore coat protein GerQ [Bacillus massiliigorillae]
MNQSGPNPYENYGYRPQQQPPYFNPMQGGQQPMYQQPMSQQPSPHPMPTTQQGQSFQGGPLEASGGLLVPTPPSTPTTGPQIPGMLPLEQSYVENILRLNKGKLATVYMTFENNQEWNAKIFKGIIEAAGRDHIILSDPQTGIRYILLMVYLDYITFDEEIEYEYPFASAQPLATYSPR